MKQPNILLIMTDEMRGDCVGVRHPDVKTPYLDTLIARGTYFPNAVTACPSCIAAPHQLGYRPFDRLFAPPRPR